MEKKRKIPPPVYLLMTLVLMWLMNHFFPVYRAVYPPAVYLGIIPVIFGITMAAIAAGMFKKAETGLVPFEEATTLVTDGFYRYTRNPMYMGMFLMLLGGAILMGSIGALLPVPLFIGVIRNHFVLAEERFLAAAFSQQYLDYQAQVRRWI